MPLSTHYSYLDTGREFLLHWDGTPELSGLVLPEVITRDGFEQLLEDLATVQGEVLQMEMEVAAYVERGRELKARLRDRLVQFNVSARLWFADRPEGEVVPQVATLSAAPDRFCRPVRDALRLWKTINDGLPPPGLVLPLMLPGGFGREEMEALLTEYNDSRSAQEEAEYDLALLRAGRDALETRVREALVAYNQTVLTHFAKDDPTGASKPRLFPLPGDAQDAVALRCVWDEDRQGAVLTWDASDDPNLKGYQLRRHAGDKYQRRGSILVANFSKGAPREYFTREGLENPGDCVSFCVYTVKRRGRHKSGKPVAIRRP